MRALSTGLVYQMLSYLHAKRTFKEYRPQQVSWRTVANWLKPYDVETKKLLYKLLTHVRYYTEKETADALVSGNDSILKMLQASGLQLDRVIYVQVHDAGSSSAVMLNLLRDTAKIEKSGCKFVDANSRKLANLTRDMGEGAIVYIDDFAGSGKQFTRVHKEVSQYITGRFVEFFLAPCVAEEAKKKIEDNGVEVITSEVHRVDQRPLKPESNLLTQEERGKLIDISQKMYAKPGMGFAKLATMVVFARQCPNSVPLLLRGSLHQTPYCGILPRSTDLDTTYRPVKDAMGEQPAVIATARQYAPIGEDVDFD